MGVEIPQASSYFEKTSELPEENPIFWISRAEPGAPVKAPDCVS